MSDDSQILIPASFIALFVPPGRSRPLASRQEIAARHELCEDLATMLSEPAATQQWDLGVSEGDVLERMHRGLLGESAIVSAAEAQWVVQRLAELLGWGPPVLAPPGAPA